MMYKVMQSVVHAGGYKLVDIQHKIKKLWLQGDLTETQAEQLLSQAAAGATASAERPEFLDMIRNLSGRVDALAAEVAALKNATGTTEPDTEAAAYESWTPWNGISNKYQYGAIVAHGGKDWISTFVGQNVWEPGVVGNSFWTEYQEDQYDDHEESGLLEEG